MIKVNYDATSGEIKGFYPDDINYASIPEPYIEIDAETHADCINNPGNRIVDVTNKVIITGTVTVTLSTDEQITALDSEYQTTISALAQDYSAALMADKLFGTTIAEDVYTEYEAAVTAYTTALETIG
ncbi:MAG: hypothetical protein H6Q71_677 [Firmicutes bacterium]|nr:hypothetical protein [Bacillota bacterium]